MARRHGDMQVYDCFDLRKGLDVKTSPRTLALSRGQNALRLANNMVFTSSGAVTKRFDQATLTSSSVGAAVAITGGHQLRRSNGNDYELFGTDDGKVYRLNSDGTTTELANGLTSSTKHYFTTYNDLAIWGNRADAPKKYDGTTWGNLGGSPPSTAGPWAVHGNRVFALDATQKSRLSWCALNDEEDWTTASNAGSLLVSENDGFNAMNLIASINELVILKGSRPYRLQGTSPSTFALTNLVPTTGSTGSISHQAAVFALNDVWYLGTPGVVALSTVFNFGDLKARFASERIDPYFTAGSDYTLTLQNLDDACMAYDPQNNRLYVAVDSNADGKNDLVLAYDIALGAWSIWTSQSIASMWPVYNATTGVTEIHAGTYTGHVIALNRDVSTNAIDGHARHLSCLNAPGIEKSPRYGYLYLKEEGAGALTVDTKFDFGATGGQTYTVSLNGGSHLLGSSFVLGTSVLGGKDQIVKRIDLSGIGEYLELGFRNQIAGQTFELYGYQILWRPRRTVRRGTGG